MACVRPPWSAGFKDDEWGSVTGTPYQRMDDDQVLSAYALACDLPTRSRAIISVYALATQPSVLSVYPRATPCPVLAERMTLPCYARSVPHPVRKHLASLSAYALSWY
eukprot:2895714-Rhodomonas_salina.2